MSTPRHDRHDDDRPARMPSGARKPDSSIAEAAAPSRPDPNHAPGQDSGHGPDHDPGRDPALARAQALAELLLERRLDEAGRLELEGLVLASPAARTFYIEYLHQHAALAWSAAAPEFLHGSGRHAPEHVRLPAGIPGGPPVSTTEIAADPAKAAGNAASAAADPFAGDEFASVFPPDTTTLRPAGGTASIRPENGAGSGLDNLALSGGRVARVGEASKSPASTASASPAECGEPARLRLRPGGATAEPASIPDPVRTRTRRSMWWGVGLAWAATTALVVGLAWWGASSVVGGRAAPKAVATLVKGKALKWEGATTSTELGARLPAGRLRLAEGIAVIVFDSGAEVTIEAPADLELFTAARCTLHAGRLVAKVPEQAVGFVVDTATAEFRDLGTEFGVSVADGGHADLQVFNGIVDVTHRNSGGVQRLRTGGSVRVSESGTSDLDGDSEINTRTGGQARPDNPPGTRTVRVSTATGRGRDAWVARGPKFGRGHDTLLLVKNTAGKTVDHDRKTWLAFDLVNVAGGRITDASLTLTFAPTGLGFAAEVPDATFAVYGLTDQAADDWKADTLTWQTAPANILTSGGDLDPAKVVKLGTFGIVQGEMQGTRTVGGPALADFLNRDMDGVATLILVRETKGSGRSCLVHGFAGRKHPTLPPPTLQLTVSAP